MGKTLKRFALALCVLALCISTMGTAVFAASTVTVNIPVRIALSGTEPAVPEAFVVEVTAADPAYPMPTGASNGIYRMAMEGKSSETIEIEFNAPGVYDYTVKQESGTNDDCCYDDAVYYVTVFVTNSETGSGYGLSVVVCRGEEAKKRDGILFENVYANPGGAVITAVKTLDSKPPEDGAFTFELLDSNGKQVKAATNVGKNVTFEMLRYDKAGTYKYQLREVQGSDSKIIYDKAVYDVTVEVVKDADGNYAATVTYERDGGIYTGAPVFANETKTDSPRTGDDFQIWLWITLLVLSVTGTAATLVLGRKLKKI